MATLKAQHLAKSYKGRQVVRDVSMSIDSGQIVGLLGRTVPARPPAST